MTKKRVEIVTYAIMAIFIGIMTYFDYLEIIDLDARFAILLLGIFSLIRGIFGIVDNELALGNASPLKYSKSSFWGKLVNIILILIGAVVVSGVIISLILSN